MTDLQLPSHNSRWAWQLSRLGPAVLTEMQERMPRHLQPCCTGHGSPAARRPAQRRCSSSRVLRARTASQRSSVEAIEVSSSSWVRFLQLVGNLESKVCVGSASAGPLPVSVVLSCGRHPRTPLPSVSPADQRFQALLMALAPGGLLGCSPGRNLHDLPQRRPGFASTLPAVRW